jgi:acetate kinase
MTDLVLVINAGSSSLKYSLIDPASGEAVATGLVERIGEAQGVLTHRGPSGETRTEHRVADHEEALRSALAAFRDQGPNLDDVGLVAVGHRVVHGGSAFSTAVLVDDQVLRTVRELVPLAPLHNAPNLEGMEVARRVFPKIPQVAVFDTAFHQTLPPHAYTYAVPLSWREEHQVRRYGFHGTSYAFVSRAVAELLSTPLDRLNMVVLHLGNGCSAAAVEHGRSVETSMGLTPLEGLVMGSRSGDLDPAIPGHLHRRLGWSLNEIDEVLNRDSGLKGLTGENDFRELERMRASGDPHAELAFQIYCHRLRKYVGAYYAVLGTVDAVVFTGGVGQHSPAVRSATLTGLSRLGIELDPAANSREIATPTRVSSAGSAVAVLVVPTNEEWEIARQAISVVHGDD